MKRLFLIFILFNLTGCYTIHFLKDSDSSQGPYTYTSWHHIGLLGLMEFSSPVDLKATCGGPDQWGAVRVQTGLVQGLVRMITIPTGSNTIPTADGSTVAVPTGIPIGSFYSPEQVSISCNRN